MGGVGVRKGKGPPQNETSRGPAGLAPPPLGRQLPADQVCWPWGLPGLEATPQSHRPGGWRTGLQSPWKRQGGSGGGRRAEEEARPLGSLNRGSGFCPAFPGDSERLVEKHLENQSQAPGEGGTEARSCLLPAPIPPLNPPLERTRPLKGGVITAD